jgi:hypothetical protein
VPQSFSKKNGRKDGQKTGEIVEPEHVYSLAQVSSFRASRSLM